MAPNFWYKPKRRQIRKNRLDVFGKFILGPSFPPRCWEAKDASTCSWRTRLVQHSNIGTGFYIYTLWFPRILRVSSFRFFFVKKERYFQKKTSQKVEGACAGSGCGVTFSDMPYLRHFQSLEKSPFFFSGSRVLHP